jgi:HTH-type transcriptional regulator / antitoxin HigA
MIKPIKNNAQYEHTLQRIYDLMQKDLSEETPEYDELEVLSILIEDYEDKMFPIEHPNPIDAIKFRMEQLGLEQKDMTRYFGYRSRVSEIFSGKRKLNLNMIRKIHRDLGIPARSLIGE